MYQKKLKKVIIKKIVKINKWFISKMRKKPKIAIMGLNPHNAELRTNSEEKKLSFLQLKISKRKGRIIWSFSF